MKYSSACKIAASLLLAGVLSACGSSNDPAPETAAPVVAAPTTFAVSGTAATGAALDGATITITGSDGKTYPAAGEAPIVTGTDGSYTITLPLTAKPPFVVTAVRSDISLVSVIAEAKDSTANVTPVTNLIASRLSSSGDPAKLAAEFLADPTLLDLAKITASVAEVVKLIQPLMDAVGDSTNPLSGNIQLAVTNGTGADKMLDSLSISIVPSSDKTVNIAVSVKQQQAEGAQPVVIAFSGGTGATAPAATLPTVVATDLVDSGNAVLIADLLKRMTACYALPQADRVVSGGTVVVDIKATACKDMFVGNDAANYLNSGAKVSSTGAFAGLFGTGTGATFDLGSYEFTRGNGDWVIAYRLTASGNVSYNTLAVRVDTDKKLRVIGNQYKYNGGVNAYQQVRNFVAQPAADYYSTGYNLTVNNTADVADIVKVVVTSPSGKTLLLKRSAASSYFPIVKSDNTITGTSFVRLARQFLDTANTGDPALADLGTFFSTDRYAAADIIAIPAQARWKFEYFTDETTIDATQYYTTRARAMTIAELQTQPLANLPAADIAEAKSSIVSNTAGTTWWLPVDGTVDVDWEVPTGALAPTSIQVYGNYVTGPTTRSGFNDKTGVKSTDRKGTIPCSNGGSGDTHCDSAGNYATSDHFNGIHLWAQDATGRDFAHFYAFYKITLP